MVHHDTDFLQLALRSLHDSLTLPYPGYSARVVKTLHNTGSDFVWIEVLAIESLAYGAVGMIRLVNDKLCLMLSHSVAVVAEYRGMSIQFRIADPDCFEQVETLLRTVSRHA